MKLKLLYLVYITFILKICVIAQNPHIIGLGRNNPENEKNLILSESEIEDYFSADKPIFMERRQSQIFKKLPFSNIAKYYLPTGIIKSKECTKAIRNLTKEENANFTMQMVDSWGKIPDGILWGNYKPWGMYEECLLLNNKHNNMKGKYCLISVTLKNKTEHDIDERLIPLFHLAKIPTTTRYGTCMPDSCSKEELNKSLSKNVFKYDLVRDVSCYTNDDEAEFTGGDISFIVFLSIVGFIMVIATITDVITEICKKDILRKGLLRYLLAFSISTNFRKLFTINTSPPKSSINCLHGMRVLSMVWVIYGHQYIYTVMYTMNLIDFKIHTQGFLFQIFANATFSVDSFFFLSGLLVAYLTIQIMEKNNGRLNIPMYYIHRYIRLTPAIAVVAWFQATIARLFIHGPTASDFTYIVTENCRNRWWTDILYVNNYANSLTEIGKLDCIGQAWYTAVDTQIFIFTPLILIPLYHYKKFGKLWFAFWTFASGLVPAIITVSLDLPPWNKATTDDDLNRRMWHYMYAAPFSRAGPYFIGMWTGYIIFKLRNKPLIMRKWQLIIGWLVSTGTALSILFGIYKYNVLGEETPDDWNGAEQFFYGGFSRLCWAIPLAWIVIMCHKGYGGPVNWILSHPAFQPLSRLTYGMYLTSIGIQNMIGNSRKIPYYFSHSNKIIETCGVLFLIGIAAIIVSLCVESPIIMIEKELRSTGPKIQKESNSIERNSSTRNQKVLTNEIPKIVINSDNESTKI